MNKENEIREELSKRLRRRISEPIWQSLVEERYVKEVMVDQSSIEDLEARYQSRLNLIAAHNSFIKEPRNRVVEEIEPDRRLRAISGLLAQKANNEPYVKEFRRIYLGGNLISVEGVEAWIRRQAQDDGLPTTYRIHREVLNGDRVEGDNPETYSVQSELLSFVSADKTAVCRINISNKGVLAAAKAISLRLSTEYGWSGDKSVLFLLCGVVPEIPKATVESIFRLGKRNSTSLRIEVEDTASPEFVREIYRDARDQIRKDINKKPFRTISDKHISLAEVYGGSKKGTWDSMMHEWNNDHPKWSYEDAAYGARNFRRDCIQAMERLIGKDSDRDFVLYIDGQEINVNSLAVSIKKEGL
ncbi:MAG: hypothetical protein QF530_05310 [SAR202 cluster bacterium]|jgi:hypothetical protein|nr:hypothetical protein [SAR202 cluster bacterium]